MNDSELRSTVLATLLLIAPEVEVALLRENRPLRLQVDLDSTYFRQLKLDKPAKR